MLYHHQRLEAGPAWWLRHRQHLKLHQNTLHAYWKELVFVSYNTTQDETNGITNCHPLITVKFLTQAGSPLQAGGLGHLF